MQATDIIDLIQNRRSVYPKSYVPGAIIERETLEALVDSARWAPTHRRTEPWRFQVFHSEESRRTLSAYLSDYFEKNTAPELFSEEKKQKAGESPLRAGAVIAIVMQRDPDMRIPEFEEIASVAMAVQNMWLHCSAIGLGAYWSTPKAMLEANEFLSLDAGQRCLGLFYVSHHEMPTVPGIRESLDNKVRWL